jgi:nucleoside-diphosphate-sugar epimerase
VDVPVPLDSTPRPALVTGATGLLGSHLAERLVAGGTPVRALVRPGADAAYLRTLGVELVPGDLLDPAACARAVGGVDAVYHAAAKVGDWGSWAEFKTGCLDATDNLAGAAHRAGVRRFVHISSTSAYGHPPEGGPPVTEDDPLGQNFWPIWDHYTRSKVEQERRLWALAGRGLPLTVIRPSWLYGERDRTTTRRLVDRLERGQMQLIGRGDNPLSAIYAGEVAAAAVRAAGLPIAAGRAYNVTDQGPITQRDFFALWAEAVGVPPAGRRKPYGLVFGAALGLEAAWKLARSRKPPLITRYATWLMGRDVRYSTDRARAELGWSPALGYPEAIGRTVAWLRSSRTGAARPT